MKPVRVIVFDAVGTLIHTRPPVAAIYHAIGQQFGSRLDQPTIAARFKELFGDLFERSGLSPARPFSDATHRQLWQTLVTRLFTDLGDTGPLFDVLWDRFADPTTWAVYPDVMPTLIELRSAGYRLAIGSNFDSRLHRIIASLPELQPIERMFTIAETQFAKPDRRFFDHIATTLSVAPPECLMVGDSLRDDIHGPLAAGWQAIHLDRSATSHGATGFGIVQSLGQLFDYMHKTVQDD
jgi:putative hydrolase of the HAD superfamily